MAITVSLNGILATEARITLPAWGIPYADVHLDGEHTLTGSVSLVVSDFTLVGTVLSGGPAVGRSFYRIIGGKGGWAKTISRASYANDGGVKLVTVLGDAAAACGETLDMSTVDSSVRLGPFFVRPEDQASRLLAQLSPNAWYVGEDGVTRLGQRPKTTLSTNATRTSQVDRARGTVTLASDSIASIVPGVVVDGLEAVDVEHEVSKNGLRSIIWGRIGTGNSRRLSAYYLLLNALDPGRKYRGTYEYRVVTQEGERLNLQTVRVSTGMPDIRRVPVRAGVMGAKGQPALGSRVLLTFVDADPSRPVVVAFEDAESGSGGFVPLNVSLDASTTVAIGSSATKVTLGGGGHAIARVGDTVNAGYLVTTTTPPGGVTAYFPGTTIGQAAAQTAAAALTPPGVVVAMTNGAITVGSQVSTSA